ncbi:hypothetical protein V6N13_090933 [Hibiscus sabdariffa]|uniref:Uncharacterized protein n=1 Tax=Hibiscus sabdariffa TaxID=183260 RepID=A0ABR2PBF2_9ROSI
MLVSVRGRHGRRGRLRDRNRGRGTADGAATEPLPTLEDVTVVEADGAEASLVGRTPLDEPEAAEGVGTVNQGSVHTKANRQGPRQRVGIARCRAAR